MPGEILHTSDFETVYLPGVSALVTTEAVYPTTSKSKDEYKVTIDNYKVAPWGDSNNRPAEIYEKARKVSTVPKSLELLGKLLYGQGIRYGFVKDLDDKGGEVLEFRRVKTVEQFMSRSNINNRFLLEAIVDLKWFGNLFTELLFNKADTQIIGAVVQEAPWCRLTSRNKLGFSEHCLISADWPSPSENYTAVPSFDIYDLNRIEYVKKKKFKKAIIHTSFPSPMREYYQEPAWWSLLDSGWMEQAMLIPKLKEAILKNSMTIKYLIRIPKSYWSDKYKNWNELEQEQRDKLKKDELQKLNEMLTGVEKAGTSIITHFDTNSDGKDFAKWDITPIESKIQDGLFNLDSQEATAQMLYAIGIDPSVFGLSIGKGMGAGSGSDKRVAFNILDVLSTAERNLIVEPLHFIRDYNGWNEDLRFFIAGHNIVTLDTDKEIIEKQAA